MKLQTSASLTSIAFTSRCCHGFFGSFLVCVKGRIEDTALTFLQRRGVITKDLQFRFMKQQQQSNKIKTERKDGTEGFFKCPAKCGNYLIAEKATYSTLIEEGVSFTTADHKHNLLLPSFSHSSTILPRAFSSLLLIPLFDLIQSTETLIARSKRSNGSFKIAPRNVSLWSGCLPQVQSIRSPIPSP